TGDGKRRHLLVEHCERPELAASGVAVDVNVVESVCSVTVPALVFVVHSLRGGESAPGRTGKQVFPERNRWNLGGGGIREAQPHQLRGRRKVVHAGSGIFEVRRRSHVPLEKRAVRQSSDIGPLDKEAVPKLAP